MQTIPDTYKQAGHVMQLMKREGNAAMFKAFGDDYWEVHRVRVSPAESIRGRPYPEREVLAGNEAFGEHGWACISQDRADARFNAVLAGNALDAAGGVQ
jgi:hypothetical protein